MNQPEWTRDWPTEPGLYWFYGFRYGHISVGIEKERELLLVRVNKTQTGVMCVAEGHFMYKSEPEDARFIKVLLPKFPEVED